MFAVLKLIFVALIILFVIFVYFHDKKNEDSDALYEEWKEEHHIKDL